jgi:hypothetical protein
MIKTCNKFLFGSAYKAGSNAALRAVQPAQRHCVGEVPQERQASDILMVAYTDTTKYAQ